MSIRASKGPLVRMLLAFTSFCFLAMIFRVGAEKNLIRTVTPNEWGRTLYAVSAAITQQKFGIRWFAVDEVLENTLKMNGLTADPALLAPLGLTYPDNLQNAAQLQRAIDKAMTLEVPSPAEDPNPLYPRLRGASGDDPAYSAYATLSFALFGTHIASMYYTYFVLMAIALGLYLVAHKESVPALVAMNLAMTALYLIAASELLSILPTPHFGTNELDIKDPRFLSTLAALPVLHLLMVFLRSSPRLRLADFLALIGQSILIAFTIAIRASTAWVCIGIALLWLLLTVRHWWQTDALEPLWRRTRPYSVPVIASFVAIIIAGHLVVLHAEHPLYRVRGEISSHLFWQGLLYQQLSNRNWTREYGASVNYKNGDDMPIEVAKITIAKLPAAEQKQYLTQFGTPTISAAEKFSREWLFEMVRGNPGFIAQTYFIYVPIRLAHTGRLFLYTLCTGLSFTTIGAVTCWLAILAWLMPRRDTNNRLAQKITFAGGLMALVSLLPYWLISVNIALLVDFFLWGLFLALAESVACLSHVFLTLGDRTTTLESPPAV